MAISNVNESVGESKYRGGWRAIGGLRLSRLKACVAERRKKKEKEKA